MESLKSIGIKIGSILVAFLLVGGIFLVKDFLPEPSVSEEEEAFNWNELGERDDTTTPQSPEALRKYQALAARHRDQMQNLYLEIVRELFRRNPRYTDHLGGVENWPLEQFTLDFRSFAEERRNYLNSCPAEALEVENLLDEAASQLIALLSQAMQEQRPLQREQEERIRNLLFGLDSLITHLNPSEIKSSRRSSSW